MVTLTRADFNHQIKYDPEPEDAGTIRVNARIFGKDVPASKLVVKSLARKMYDKVSSTGKTCAICFEEFEDERSVVVILPCGHVFDDECAVKWFEINHVCPLCRFELPCEDQ
ncbi:PREDICTED: E3 ubiquitin-protein ligase RING1-like [Camelina sativa]|uniref:RING-type E3 ubiquitin transferase n=1 Tax=Camelina sativa TaxID=90675 RepID=A0ABM0T0C5_CAMSA|nr:PREDICTED: E3 ubiquitin-protein ligase RING1-like [Camelina sativa]